jgi:diguanylate cyclase (GGDEF)-like protein
VSGIHHPHVDLSTGAFLRPYFLGLLGDAVAQAHRDEVPLVLLYVDLDEAAVLQGERGQSALEAALSTLAQAVGAAVDGLGPIGRLGDDSFAVLLMGCPYPHAMRVAHAVRKSVAEQPVRCAQERFSITASVGVAALRTAEPWGNLLEAAEDACTRAKQGGRNRVAPR